LIGGAAGTLDGPFAYLFQLTELTFLWSSVLTEVNYRPACAWR